MQNGLALSSSTDFPGKFCSPALYPCPFRIPVALDCPVGILRPGCGWAGWHWGAAGGRVIFQTLTPLWSRVQGFGEKLWLGLLVVGSTPSQGEQALSQPSSHVTGHMAHYLPLQGAGTW